MKGVFIILVFLGTFSGYGQDLLTPFMDSSYQQTYFNPGAPISGTVNISTGISGALSSNSLSYRDLIQTNSNGDNFIQPDNSADKLKDDNYLSTDFSVHTLDVGINFSNVTILAGHAWKLNGIFDYPRDLALLVINGNAPYIGQTLNVGPGFEYTAYNEIYLGASVAIGNVRIGLKGKHLSGVENVDTERRKIDVTTSDDIYQITVESDYIINSSRLLEFNDITDFSFDFESLSFRNFLSRNTGFAMDAGLHWAVNDRLNLGLSILDIGSITWDNDPRNYISQQTQTFDGIDIVSYLGDTTTIALEDSLYNLLAFEQSQNAYSTTLPVKMILSASLMINDHWSVGAIVSRRNYKSTSQTSLGLHTGFQINRLIALGTTLHFSNESIMQWGLSGRLNAGLVDLMASCNNIVALFEPLNHKSVQIRLGATLRI